MRIMLLIVGISVGAVVSIGKSEVIEIHLPELLGTYPVSVSNGMRTALFELPQPPTIVNGASFRVSGTAEVGQIVCEFTDTLPRHMDLNARMFDPASGRTWWASELMPMDPGQFTWTGVFHSSYQDATWSFLMDGNDQITLYGWPSGYVDVCYDLDPQPTAVVTEAVLIVDAEFPIPVEPMTWGRVKALYSSLP